MKLFKCFAIAATLWSGLSVANVNADSLPDRESVRHGSRVWADNCARCHNVRKPSEYTDVQWRPVISHMRIQAGLTGDEARDVLAFLQAINE